MQRGARSRAAAAAGQQAAATAAAGREAAGAAGAAGIPHITFRPFQPQPASLAAVPPVLPIPVPLLPSTASSLGAGVRLAGFGSGPTRSSAGSLFGGRGAAAELGLTSPFASAVPYDQRRRQEDAGEVSRSCMLLACKDTQHSLRRLLSQLVPNPLCIHCQSHLLAQSKLSAARASLG